MCVGHGLFRELNPGPLAPSENHATRPNSQCFIACCLTQHGKCNEIMFLEHIRTLFCNQTVRNNAPTRGVPSRNVGQNVFTSECFRVVGWFGNRVHIPHCGGYCVAVCYRIRRHPNYTRTSKHCPTRARMCNAAYSKATTCISSQRMLGTYSACGPVLLKVIIHNTQCVRKCCVGNLLYVTL